MALTVYADADHVGCQDTRRSTSGSAQFLDTMADAEHAPAMAPPVRTDEQILPRIRWVPIGKSNCYLNEEKSQPSPIYKIAVDILKQTNFFRAFTASSTIPAIYIQQFWDTICFDSKAGSYKCQLDEQWMVQGSLCSQYHVLVFTDEITSAPYYSRYLEHVAEYQRCLDEEHGKAEEEDVTESPKAAKATKSKTAKQTKPSAPKASKVTKPPKPTPTTTEPSKKDQTKDIQRAVELSIKEQAERTQGPARPVVIREPDSGRIQPLPDVQGKGKEKVSDEQVALDLLTLQTPKKKSPAEQYIFQRRTPTTTEPSGHAESPSLYAELGLTDSETESDEEVSPEINAGTQDEGQAGPNPGEQDEGQAGPNPGDAAESQPQSNHAGPNLEHMDFEENLKLPTEDQVILEEPASSVGTLSSLQNLDKELSFTNQFLMEKSQEDEPDKSNTEAEVQSMVMVPNHQDTSSVPLMTTLVIDLTNS
ncbi:hypothetical protein Tco_1437552 [Tanacetum coccineum]